MPKADLVRSSLLVLLLIVSTGCRAKAFQQTPVKWPLTERETCASGSWPIDGRCIPAETAFTAVNGQTYWVDQRNPLSDDRNPGTVDQPWRTISRATSVLQPGDAVLIRAGVYRESIRPRVGGRDAGHRVTYAAYPGDEVIISGADVTDSAEWVRTANGWRRIWTGPAMPTYSNEESIVMRREMVIADGEVLTAVSHRNALEPGSFYVEGTPSAQEAIVARFPDDRAPSEVGVIELAHRTHLFQPTGRDPYPDCGDSGTPGWLHIVGITFKHASNRAQWGAFCAGSRGSLIEDVTVEWTNGAGIDASGDSHVFSRTSASHNGQIGFVASCRNCLFEDTAAIGNNWKGYDMFWEAGGGKWSYTTNSTIRRHHAANNHGPGIWLDGYNTENVVEHCLVESNEMAGIMLEMETRETLIQHNTIRQTSWMGYSGSGILSQAASRNIIVHNTILENEGTGLWIRQDPSHRASDGYNIVYNNVLVRNAWTQEKEAREVTVEGEAIADVRTNSFGGNLYGRHASNDLRTSVFFVPADPSEVAGFRGVDLGRWEELTGERGAALIDSPPGRLAEQIELYTPVSLQAVPLWMRMFEERIRIGMRPGANWD